MCVNFSLSFIPCLGSDFLAVNNENTLYLLPRILRDEKNKIKINNRRL